MPDRAPVLLGGPIVISIVEKSCGSTALCSCGASLVAVSATIVLSELGRAVRDDRPALPDVHGDTAARSLERLSHS